MVLSEARRHLGRDAAEVGVLTGVFGGLQALGLMSALPLWAFLLLAVGTAAATRITQTVWGEGSSVPQMHARLAAQVFSAVVLVYATGWGAGLVVALAFVIANTVKLSGAKGVPAAFAWCLAGTILGQAGIVFGVFPTKIGPPAVHGLAALGVLGLGLVGTRIERMARDLEEAERGVRSSEQRFRSLVQNSSDVIVVIGGDSRIEYISPSVHRVFGYLPEELMDGVFFDQIHPDDLPEIKRFVAEVAAQPGIMSMVECRLRHADGGWRHVESVGNNLLDDPDLRGFVLNTRDVTERKSLEEQLAHRAFHDELTGLANRALFADRVGHAAARQARRPEPIAVLFCDLDGFKAVNDTLGHAAGDELLVQVSERLDACAREVDTVARLGGDEFAILLEDLRDESGPARVAERVLEAISEPFLIRGKSVTISASVGIAVSSEGEHGSEDLLRNADIAMYMAKGSGKNRYEIFEPSMHVAVVQRLEIEADLQRALDREEFVLHYQPIVELDSSQIIGVEALVRWNHPERGLVPPNDFIPVTEETGLIIQLGRWVLNEACAQAALWQTEYPTHPPLQMSVNLSARQLAYTGIVEDVAAALEGSGVAPGSLTLEITETALVVDTETTISRLSELKTLGVRLAIDDFGTGYSSLSYLQRFPVDILKIDRSFIDSVQHDSNPALVRAIVELGRTLELETVAEGIERDDQLSQFRALQCQHGQGYLFARPASSADIDALFAQQGWPRKPRGGVGVIKSEVVRAEASRQKASA